MGISNRRSAVSLAVVLGLASTVGASAADASTNQVFAVHSENSGGYKSMSECSSYLNGLKSNVKAAHGHVISAPSHCGAMHVHLGGHRSLVTYHYGLVAYRADHKLSASDQGYSSLSSLLSAING